VAKIEAILFFQPLNIPQPFVNPLTFHDDRARQKTLLTCFPEVGDIRGARKKAGHAVTAMG